ncbi:type II toxin-antitoxin system antitoxin SocA domain-containing protein [Chitinophaga solisilvae]|uniref:type II toxin-antitoxin system antitoxin SocA domain-containing protein n=1 Tax=Chitinophaga solisilvae TaxID=1233460 RepID=UPI00136865A2|nr:type II toxin-antitoxin system antitoxin SocA domain-containing protein [Chitinophaga solisilvae]
MKSPFTGGSVRLEKETRSFEYRKEAFGIVYHYYICNDTGEEFTTAELDTLNISQVHNKYRSRYGIPPVEEIKQIRTKYGLSAAGMSEILGLGINIYRNYEAGEMPSISIGRYIRLIAEPQEFLKLVEINKYNLEPATYTEITGNVLRFLEVHPETAGQSELALFNNVLPNIYNGFRAPETKRIGEMIRYFAKELQPFTTALNKLLFYADFSHYKKFGKSISGLTYKAFQMGPVPTNYAGLYNQIVNNGYVQVCEVDFGDFIGDRFQTLREAAEAITLTPQELQTIAAITEKFKGISTSQLVRLSHEESAWMENVEKRAEISYEYSFELKHD